MKKHIEKLDAWLRESPSGIPRAMYVIPMMLAVIVVLIAIIQVL